MQKIARSIEFHIKKRKDNSLTTAQVNFICHRMMPTGRLPVVSPLTISSDEDEFEDVDEFIATGYADYLANSAKSTQYTFQLACQNETGIIARISAILFQHGYDFFSDIHISSDVPSFALQTILKDTKGVYDIRTDVLPQLRRAFPSADIKVVPQQLSEQKSLTSTAVVTSTSLVTTVTVPTLSQDTRAPPLSMSQSLPAKIGSEDWQRSSSGAGLSPRLLQNSTFRRARANTDSSVDNFRCLVLNESAASPRESLGQTKDRGSKRDNEEPAAASVLFGNNSIQETRLSSLLGSVVSTFTRRSRTGIKPLSKFSGFSSEEEGAEKTLNAGEGREKASSIDNVPEQKKAEEDKEAKEEKKEETEGEEIRLHRDVNQPNSEPLHLNQTGPSSVQNNLKSNKDLVNVKVLRNKSGKKRKNKGVKKANLVQSVPIGGGPIWTVAFSPGHSFLATGGEDKQLRVWLMVGSPAYTSLLEQGELSDALDKDQVVHQGPVQKYPWKLFTGHTDQIIDISWSHCDREDEKDVSTSSFLLSASIDSTVRLWHVSRDTCMYVFQHPDVVTSVAFHPTNSSLFACGSMDKRLRLWNILTESVVEWVQADNLITSLSFSPQGNCIACGLFDGRLMVYDTQDLKYRTQLSCRNRRGPNSKGKKVTGLSFCQTGKYLLVTTNDSRVRLYDMDYYVCVAKYKGLSNNKLQIRATFSQNEDFVLCGSDSHFLYCWHTWTKTEDRDKGAERKKNHKNSEHRYETNDSYDKFAVCGKAHKKTKHKKTHTFTTSAHFFSPHYYLTTATAWLAGTTHEKSRSLSLSASPKMRNRKIATESVSQKVAQTGEGARGVTVGGLGGRAVRANTAPASVQHQSDASFSVAGAGGANSIYNKSMVCTADSKGNLNFFAVAMAKNLPVHVCNEPVVTATSAATAAESVGVQLRSASSTM